MRTSALACAVLAAGVSAEVYFEDNFETDPFESNRWVVSDWRDGDSGKWGWQSGEWSVDAEKEKGLFTTDDMKFYAISSKLDKSFSNKEKDLVVQFSVKHEKKEYAFCGGGYIKLLPEGLDQKNFGGDSEYSIMFGPDLCGYDVSRIHSIFTNSEGENLLREPDVKLEYAEKNEFTHLYTLVVHPDDTYEILFDLEVKVSGNLDEDWGFPSKIIPDPSDTKPEDWVDQKKIDDPEDVKPEGYDDIPTQIPDPEAEMPEDWDEEDDGEWEPPMIDNPEYKGPWSAKRIENPEYKGEWEQKTMDNPDYVGGYYAYDSLAYVGFELWVVNNGSIFDNILVTDDLEYAKKVGAENFTPISEGEKKVQTAWKAEQKAIKAAEEEAAAALAAEDGEDEDDLDDEEERDEKAAEEEAAAALAAEDGEGEDEEAAAALAAEDGEAAEEEAAAALAAEDGEGEEEAAAALAAEDGEGEERDEL